MSSVLVDPEVVGLFKAENAVDGIYIFESPSSMAHSEVETRPW